MEECKMTKGVIRFIEERGRLLAVVNPAAIGTKIDPTSFWQGLMVDFVKERIRRGIGRHYPLRIPAQDRVKSGHLTSRSRKARPRDKKALGNRSKLGARIFPVR